MHLSRSDGTRVSLPVTPLLDVTFQLLFFFVVTFPVSAPEGEIEVSLLRDSGVDAPPALDELDLRVVDFPRDLTVQVGASQDGEISALFVRNALAKQTAIDGLDGLRRHLADMSRVLPHQESIKVEGDARLKVRHLLRVMDVCRQMGFTKVSLVAPENTGR
jgi:biopolymer transport protein ExbD